jgi:hypothetical protein
MRSAVVVACVLLGTCAPAAAQVSIGINLGAYPDLVAAPGDPVCYAPWDTAAPERVPFFVLQRAQAPVREPFRHPPARAAPPQRQAQAERDRRSPLRADIRRDITVAVEGVVHPRRALQGQSPGVEEKKGTLHRQLPGAAILLLGLALLSGASATAPAQASREDWEHERDH